MDLNRKPKHLTPQDAPRLALVSGVAPSNRTPVALAGLAHAAALWAPVVDGRQGEVARTLGIGQQIVSRYGTGDRLLPFGDVLAAGPEIAGPLLAGAQAYVDGQRTGAVDLAHEAVMVVAEASQLLVVLQACPVEVMGEEAVRRAIKMVDSAAERLAEMRVRLTRALERLRRGGR